MFIPARRLLLFLFLVVFSDRLLKALCLCFATSLCLQSFVLCHSPPAPHAHLRGRMGHHRWPRCPSAATSSPSPPLSLQSFVQRDAEGVSHSSPALPSAVNCRGDGQQAGHGRMEGNRIGSPWPAETPAAAAGAVPMEGGSRGGWACRADGQTGIKTPPTSRLFCPHTVWLLAVLSADGDPAKSVHPEQDSPAGGRSRVLSPRAGDWGHSY